MNTVHCYHCKNAWEFEPPLSRSSDCPHCRRPAKVCLNCLYYDPAAHHECREVQAEWVKYKDQGNFCSYFSPRGATDTQAQDATKARDALSALFGSQAGEKNSSSASASSATAAQGLEALFKADHDTPASGPSSLQAELEKFLKSK